MKRIRRGWKEEKFPRAEKKSSSSFDQKKKKKIGAKGLLNQPHRCRAQRRKGRSTPINKRCTWAKKMKDSLDPARRSDRRKTAGRGDNGGATLTRTNEGMVWISESKRGTVKRVESGVNRKGCQTGLLKVGIFWSKKKEKLKYPVEWSGWL